MALYVDVHKKFDTFSLDVDFEVEQPHETLALLGASGSGKSLTLKCIAGVLKPDSGRIVLNDRVLFDSEERVNVPAQQRHVGYLFQQYALFPSMTVEQNIGAGAVGCSRTERARRVAEQVRTFQLEGLERRHPSELSGGQQQRVALARIFVGEPELILLDEPLSALDEHLRWQLELELSDVLKAFPGGAVYVSHNRDEVMRLCDTVCVVSEGSSESKLSVSELFQAPPTLAAALISGYKNVSRARLLPGGALACDDWGVELATAHACGGEVAYAGIQPHALEASAPDGAAAVGSNSFECRVARVVRGTFTTIALLEAPGGAELRYECDNEVWKALDGLERVAARVDPAYVMPLTAGAGAEVPDPGAPDAGASDA